MTANLFGQEQWARRGESDARVASLEASRTADEATLALINTGAWTAYTPAWTSTGTLPVLGNGALAGRYTRIGKTIHGVIYTAMGSTTTFGTGNYLWSLPVSAQNALFDWQALGTAKGYHAGSNLFGQITLMAGTGGAKIRVMYSATAPAGAETYVAQTQPWTWATGDDITFHFTYEAA